MAGKVERLGSSEGAEIGARLQLSLNTLGRRFPLRCAAGALRGESYWAHL